MNINLFFKLIIINILWVSIYGCSGLGEPVEVRLEPDFIVNQWTDEVQDRSHIIVTSLTDQPIKIQAISINRGSCNSRLTKGSSHLQRYGSFLKVTLQNCEMRMVKEVELIIDENSYIYNF